MSVNPLFAAHCEFECLSIGTSGKTGEPRVKTLQRVFVGPFYPQSSKGPFINYVTHLEGKGGGGKQYWVSICVTFCYRGEGVLFTKLSRGDICVANLKAPKRMV